MATPTKNKIRDNDVVQRATAVGDPGHKKFSLDNHNISRKKAKDVLGPLFFTMDKSPNKVERKVPTTGVVRKAVAKMQGGRTSVAPGTTARTKSFSPKTKAKPITKKKVK